MFLFFSSFLFLFFSFFTPPLSVTAADTILVNAGQTLNSTSNRPLGINVNYLMDDDANRQATRSTQTALRDLGVKYLRYPGGDKSDSYLWSVPPFTSPLPSLSRTGPNEWPSGDSDLVESDYRTFKINPLDFDEFMSLTRAIGTEPVIVVNFDSAFKPAEPGGTAPTLDQLLETAVAWVRYANITKGYAVKYWEIGNESETGSSNGTPTVNQYVSGLIQFSRSMKAVDPAIKIGANGHTYAWWQQLITQAAPDIDFLVAHNYPAYQWGSYQYYVNNNPSLISEINTALTAVDAFASPADKSRLKIAVTETNSADWSGAWSHVNNLGHALVMFDTIGQHLRQPRILFSQLWNTRWINNNTSTQPALWDALDKYGQFNASGLALSIWGNNLFDRLVSTTDTAKVRSYASLSSSTGKLHLFLINKDLVSRPVRLYLSNYYPASSSVPRTIFTGQTPEDQRPTWTPASPLTISRSQISTTLNPLSITLLSLTGRFNPTNLITNPGFEYDALAWDDWGNTTIVTSPVKSGRKALRIGLTAGGRGQALHLEPNRSYTCSVYARLSSPSQTAWVGFTVKSLSGTETKYQSQPQTTSYTKFTHTFTTPADLSEGLAFSWVNSGTTYLYVDDYSCR